MRVMDNISEASVQTQFSARIQLPRMSVFGAQMITICDTSEALQQAQALEDWADCRERAIAKLELKVQHLLKQNRAEEAARLRYAAHYLHHAALRDRAQAAALRQSALR
jgi:chromosomal replication initiation ATPase DnaA